MKDRIAGIISSTSLQAFIIYACIGIGIIYRWLGFEGAVLGSLGVIVGYMAKIYESNK